MTRTGGLNVLLVGCTADLARGLGEDGHAVESLPATARGFPPATRDVVVLDLAVADPDPFRLARSIADASGRRKPLVLALADADSAEQDRRCRQAGIDLVLMKPVEPADLRRFLHRVEAVVQDYESFDPVI